MFCYQCQETAGCTGCTRAGVCGKSARTAALQDLLIYVTRGLCQLTTALRNQGEAIIPEDDRLVTENLFVTITNANFDDDALQARIRATLERNAALRSRLDGAGLSAAARWDGSGDWDDKAQAVGILSTADEDIRSLRELITYGLKGMAAYNHHVNAYGKSAPGVDAFLQAALAKTLDDSLTAEELTALALETGKYGVDVMAALDEANTSAYGHPEVTRVNLGVRDNPAILVSGHDLHDLEQLLEQTVGTGVDVYTHGEMLPAHAYPELKKYPHLKGNFGTAWQNQQKEFANMPAPVLFTTNCLMPPKASYADRVFTTEMVSYPEIVHIGDEKDFSPVIEKALELGGYEEDQHFTGINGGHEVTTGFGHGTILSVADKVVEAVKAGDIRHFFLVGGCDGARPGRNYFTDFVKQTPKDSIVLTLACGKYRFNDLDLGTIGGLPRLMDMGQCNDAYGAIQVAVALANAFGCGVNDLPLSMVLSWYEQKAVCILLTLLHLGIKNILLGPTLPAFISPNVLKILVDTYNIGAVTTPEADMARCLGRE